MFGPSVSIPFLEDDLEPFSSGGVSSFGGSGGGGGGCKKINYFFFLKFSLTDLLTFKYNTTNYLFLQAMNTSTCTWFLSNSQCVNKIFTEAFQVFIN